MNKERLLAVSDGIIIMIATLMILEFRVPKEATLAGLSGLVMPMLAYALSFFLVIGDWFNHHRLIRSIEVVSPRAFVLNMVWLFIMSFFPFATNWIGHAPMSVVPALFYLGVEFLWNVSYHLLGYELARENPDAKKPNLRYAFSAWYFYGIDVVCLIVVWFWPPIVLVSLAIIGLAELVQFLRNNEFEKES